MSYVEQLLYGYNHLTGAGGRQELAHSAGLGAEVAAEIHALCDAWGQPPDLGLQYPVLISHPLNATMPSMRGRLYGVICVVTGETPLFHAVVVSDAVYTGFGRNPYALARSLEFCRQWDGQQGMDRVEVDPEIRRTLVNPPANRDDIGLVDEAVMQFMLGGKLQLPIEQAVNDSERAMALIISCLPDKDRKELHFASFTTSQANAYGIAGLEAEGATFASWQRLMMARIDTGVTEQQQAYKDYLIEYLARGDMGGIARVSTRHNFTASTVNQPLVATRPNVESPVSGQRAAPAAASFGKVATVGPGSTAAAGHRPMLAATAVSSRRGALPEHGLDPSSHRSRVTNSARTTWQRSRVGAPFIKGRRGTGGRFMRTVSVLLLLFVAGWVGTMWLEGRTLAESLEWAGLPGMEGHADEVAHAGNLLEVVDVGQVYGRALKHAGGLGFGLNASADRRREKALGHLQSDATDPLLAQVALFVKLSTEGIQQSGRPDREVERLESLAKKGVVLEKEMARLELAWYSLTTSTNWADLGKLSDAAVQARRDSLDGAENGALADVRLGMGTGSTWRELAGARAHMNGMADIVRLFQAKKWSPAWEKDLARAAEKVSPTAGRATRAYRNSAFALLRLKRAERAAANRNLPFAGRFQADLWPSAQVKAILPLLRKEAGRFSDQNAPKLLAGTVGLYSALEAPDRTIDRILESSRQWKRLQSNAAVRFDHQLYDDFLERMRYEAAGRQMAKLQDPAEIPDHLYGSGVRWTVVAFADSLTNLTAATPQAEALQWQAIAAGSTDPFLGRWANHLASNLQARLNDLEQEFNAAWNVCRSQTVVVQEQARAGHDWTATWRELYTTASGASDRYGASLREHPAQQAKFVYLDTLVRALAEPRPLQVGRVTVRLDDEVLTGPTEVQLELRIPVRGGVWTSEPFTVGPSAPAGSGWVGTAALDWTLHLSPRQQLHGRVVTADGQGVLLDVSYASLAEGEGPAKLVRPHSAERGTLTFGLGLEAYWTGLRIPDPGPFF